MSRSKYIAWYPSVDKMFWQFFSQMEYGGLGHGCQLWVTADRQTDGCLRCSPHIGWEKPENGVEGDLVPNHLVGELGVGQLAGILVGPCMAGNLVTLGVHPLHDGFISLRLT